MLEDDDEDVRAVAVKALSAFSEQYSGSFPRGIPIDIS